MLVKSIPLKALNCNGQMDLYSAFASVQLRKKPPLADQEERPVSSLNTSMFTHPRKAKIELQVQTWVTKNSMPYVQGEVKKINNFSPEKTTHTRIQ